MSYRKSTNRALDKKMFSATASHTKSINVRPRVSRGGIRL